MRAQETTHAKIQSKRQQSKMQSAKGRAQKKRPNETKNKEGSTHLHLSVRIQRNAHALLVQPHDLNGDRPRIAPARALEHSAICAFTDLVQTFELTGTLVLTGTPGGGIHGRREEGHRKEGSRENWMNDGGIAGGGVED